MNPWWRVLLGAVAGLLCGFGAAAWNGLVEYRSTAVLRFHQPPAASWERVQPVPTYLFLLQPALVRGELPRLRLREIKGSHPDLTEISFPHSDAGTAREILQQVAGLLVREHRQYALRSAAEKMDYYQRVLDQIDASGLAVYQRTRGFFAERLEKARAAHDRAESPEYRVQVMGDASPAEREFPHTRMLWLGVALGVGVGCISLLWQARPAPLHKMLACACAGMMVGGIAAYLHGPNLYVSTAEMLSPPYPKDHPKAADGARIRTVLPQVLDAPSVLKVIHSTRLDASRGETVATNVLVARTLRRFNIQSHVVRLRPGRTEPVYRLQFRNEDPATARETLQWMVHSFLLASIDITNRTYRYPHAHEQDPLSLEMLEGASLPQTPEFSRYTYVVAGLLGGLILAYAWTGPHGWSGA